MVAPKLTVSKFSPSTDGATEALEAERATKPAPLCGRPPGVMGCQGPAEAGGQGCPGGRHPPGGLWDPPRAGALTGGVVEVQGHLLAAHCHAGRVFLEYGWGVMLGEGALAVHHEQRSLAASSVTHDHDLQLFPARARGGGRGRGLWDIHSREPATLAAVRGAEPGVERSQAGAGPRGRGQKNPRPP